MINKMNKKGFIIAAPLWILIVAIVFIFLIGFALFIFVTTNLYALIGAGIIALTLMYIIPAALKGTFTGTKAIFVIMIICAGVFVIFIPKIGLFEMAAYAPGYFEAPFFGTIQCSPATGGSRTSGDVNIPQSGSVIVKCPINSKECDVWLNEDSDTVIFQQRYALYKLCDRDGYNCGAERKEAIFDYGHNPNNYLFELWNDLPRNKALEIRVQECLFGYLCSDDENLDWHANIVFIPYILWQKDSLMSGINPIVGSIDCKMLTYSSYWTNRIISSTVKSKSGETADTTFQTIELPNQLAPDETYNYVSGTVTRATAGNAIQYQGQSAYCIENEQGTGTAGIYNIGILETASYKYNIVDLNNKLGTEECCIEGSIQLNRVCEDFKWSTVQVDPKTGETNVECSITRPCPTGRLPLDDSRSFKFECIDGTCKVKDIREEECADTSDCLSDEICVAFKCVSAGTVEGAIPVKEEEVTTKEACLALIAENPSRWQWIDVRTERAWYELWKPKTTITGHCKDNWQIYFILGGIGGFILLIVGILAVAMRKPTPRPYQPTYKRKSTRRKKK